MSDGSVLFRPAPVRSSLITRPRLLSQELVPLTYPIGCAGGIRHERRTPLRGN